jgi:hypothetical protein
LWSFTSPTGIELGKDQKAGNEEYAKRDDDPKVLDMLVSCEQER